MKKLFIVLIVLLTFASCQKQQQTPKNNITSDITNFWEAYDLINTTQDSVLQYHYLDSLYFQRGSEGLKAIRQSRNYTAKDYIDAIHQYPQFWNSVRANTLKADQYGEKLEEGIDQLKALYPELKPAKIYFTIGALRTGGTTLDSLVLIGSEIAMTDKNTIATELPDPIRKNRRIYFDSNPINDLVLLNIHEYVHTQQQPRVFNLLSLVIYEGVAEFISTKALDLPSAAPAIAYGKNHPDEVRAQFEHEMFYPNNRPNWLWSDVENKFGVRDLGYYIGYQICENYYDQATDKKVAIKELISLDYTNEAEIEAFLKQTNYFSAPLEKLYQNFEQKRPTVTGIEQFKNKQQDVDPNTKAITVLFSKALNGRNTGVDFGPLGQDVFPKNDVTKRYWNQDNTSWTIPVSLAPNTNYQIQITNNFRTANHIPIQPYLIEFRTGNK